MENQKADCPKCKGTGRGPLQPIPDPRYYGYALDCLKCKGTGKV